MLLIKSWYSIVEMTKNIIITIEITMSCSSFVLYILVLVNNLVLGQGELVYTPQYSLV